jgi:tetratricopeptide (TPR) repeat protein
MSRRRIEIGLPGRTSESRSQHTNLLKYITSGLGKALAILMVSISLVLGASARLLHPYSGYDIWFLSMTTALAESAGQAREQVTKLVAQIQRADYEGDRAALKQLHDELAKFGGSKQLAAQVQYWRAFALWRRAINGFNEANDVKDMQADLKQAIEEFTEADHQRANFVDAKVGALSCLGMLGASMLRSKPAGLKDPEIQEIWAKAVQLIKEADAIDPQNPRLIWAKGPNVWHIPVEKGGGPDKVIEMYEKALDSIQQHKVVASTDPLEPSWGEPELLMSLAWAKLNQANPDVNTAERYAQSALKLVPYWHYTRDILLPQIEATKAKKMAAK